MTFNEEWAHLKSTAQANATPSMELAGTEAKSGTAGDGTYAPNLTVYQDDLGTVGHDAYVLHRKLQKCADIDSAGLDGSGRSTTDRAARELDGHNFASGAALSKALKIWDTQRKTLQQGCARISNHLDYTKASHAKEDDDVAASLKTRDGDAVSTSALYKWIK
ncbi:hypothetical protein [Streptomyces sp. PU-14G]|uniref:hypothetical protein n=1 Tax=Streptomyces sp. PU-14G TaxID=2800808 RepID=UPI0034DF6E67